MTGRRGELMMTVEGKAGFVQSFHYDANGCNLGGSFPRPMKGVDQQEAAKFLALMGSGDCQPADAI
jgi:hypothetical protein